MRLVSGDGREFVLDGLTRVPMEVSTLSQISALLGLEAELLSVMSGKFDENSGKLLQVGPS